MPKKAEQNDKIESLRK